MAKDNKKDAPKLQSNTAPAPLATNHAPMPRKKGAANAPGPSVGNKLKAAWRASGKKVSLREYAEKHDMGKEWFANKNT
jgi:hypothetical protein